MSTNIDLTELRLFFQNEHCPSVVDLIDYLASEEGSGLLQIGSGTVDPFAIPGEPSSYRPHLIQNFRLGIPNQETPIQSIQKLMRGSEVLPDGALFFFDQFCNEMIDILTCPTVPFKDLPDEEQAKFE